MELAKWQNVIVDWVNCLNISKPIQSISDLKNEDFFRKLLLILTLNQNDTDNVDKCISLTEFVKTHYPAYNLEDEPTLTQDELEVCNICSLLLHYCCYIDGRQELTAPLCRDLNTASQFHIKSFLEELYEAKEISRDLINDVVNNINKFHSTPTRQFKNSPLASPKIPGNSTSLLDFLKTPLKKQQIYDSHKREIKHLQAQLDLERFEKADLQEELNLQYEKNKKLDKVISDKQSEIGRLRSELLSLESRTPPSNTKTEGKLENKRLRDEISSLEKYIEILHKEQEELQNERDKARNKLRKVEESCNEWQNRALNTERQCSNISEENEHQRNELIQLQEKCEELSSILKEINSKNVCDESYEIDHMQTDFVHNRSGSIDYDNLAHTVVDMQLIEAQEENKNLRKQVGELEQNITELTGKMNELTNELTKIFNENKLISESKNRLRQDILDMENQYKRCENELKHSEELNLNLNESLTKLQSTLSDTDFNLKYYKNENEKLIENYKVLDRINHNLNDQINNKSRNINDLLSEKTVLQKKIDECNMKVLEYKEKNELMTDLLNKIDKTLEHGLVKFESVIEEFTDGNLINCNSVTKLEKLIQILENKIQKDTKDFYHFQENCKSLNSKIYKLQEEVETLYNNEMKSQEEKNDLNISLKDSKSKIEELTNEIEQNNKIILLCKSTIEGKTNEINSLQNIILKKDNTIDGLSRERNNLKASIGKIETQLSVENSEKELSNEKVNELERNLHETLSTVQTLQEKIHQSNVDIENHKKDIYEKNNQISTLKDTIINKDKYIEELNIEKCDLLNNTKNIQSEFLAEKHAKELANIEVNNLKTSIWNIELKIKELKHSLKEKLTDIDILKNTIASNEQMIINLKDENDRYVINLEIVEDKLKNEKETKEKINNELHNVKSNLADANTKIEVLENTLEENYKLVEKLETTIKKNSNEYKEMILIKEKYIEHLSTEKINLIASLTTVENNLIEEKRSKILTEELCEKLKEEIKEQENIILNLQTQKSNLELNLESMKNEICKEKTNKTEIEKKCIQLQNVIVNIQQQMDELNVDKIDLNEQLEALKDRISTELQNQEVLLNENNELKQLNTKKDNLLQNLEKQKVSLHTNIVKLEKELQNAESCNKNLISKLNDLIKSLGEKEKLVLDFQMEQTVLQEHITTLEGMLEEESKQKLQLDTELKNLIEAIREKELHVNNLKSEKESLEKRITILNNSLSTQELVSENKIEEHVQKIQELLKEIDSLNEKFSMISIEISTIVNMLKTEEDMQINIDLDENYKDCNSLDTLLKTIVNLKNNICSLIFEKRRLDNETTSLQQQISAIENLKSAVEEDYKKLIGELNEKNSSLQSSVEVYKSQNQDCRKKINKAEKELESAAKNIGKLLTDHSKEIDKYKNDLERMSEENETNIKQLIFHKTDSTNELLALKLEFKDTLVNYQANVEHLNNVKEERNLLKKEKLELLEENNALTLKVNHSTKECNKLTSSINVLVTEIEKLKEYISNCNEEKESLLLKLNELNKNYDELKLCSTENENKIKETESSVLVKEQQITELNLKLAESTEKILEYKTAVQEMENTQTKITEEMNFSCNSVEKLLDQEIEFRKKMENLLSNEEHKVNNLTKQVTELSSDQENLIDLCVDAHNKFHSLYTLLFEDKEDNEISQQINKFNNQEKQLKTLFDEKELVGREYDFISMEVAVLKKAFKELSNYETLKTELLSIKSQYDQLKICETENNNLKTQLSTIENKLSDLQLENTKYQNQISEKEIDHKNMKSRYEEELNLMKSTCNNWQKIVCDNETEHKKLLNEHKNIKEKYDLEMDVLRKSNTTLEDTVTELQQHINHNNNVIIEHQAKYEDIIKKYQAATEKISSLDPEIISLQDKITDYKKAIAILENDNINLTKNYNDLSEQYKIFTEKCRQEHELIDKDELSKLRTSYTLVLSENSHLQLDCTALKKTIEERNNQLKNLTIVKEAYEKLLEENNKLNMELDTLRYKRARDKEEFKRVLEEGNTNSEQQIQEVRNEYEEKLKKMKEKIVKLYKEEVEKEKKKVCTIQQGQSEETIASLKSQLWMTGTKYVELKKENERLREQLEKLKEYYQTDFKEISRLSDIHTSRESVCSLRERKPMKEIEERRTSTLPRDMKPSTSHQSQQIDIIEESVTISRKRRSITASLPKNLDPGLKMEDEEGEIFNNTYLADLKAGRCVVTSDSRDSISSTSSRMSELQFRNSLCPPHLKSSYPAETQFSSPGQFKEEDIKTGVVDLDDSMSSSLLPGEKPRNKKDWGQTLYKKPGPPTPSKNGGRLSLQGNEVHPREVLREQNSGRTISTPSRIKGLFTRSSTASRDSENVSSTPRGQVKRRSFFRR